MNRASRCRYVLVSIATIGLVGVLPVPSVGSGSAGPPWLDPQALTDVADSVRVQPEELELLLLEAAAGVETGDQLLVDGKPVLLARGIAHIPAAAFIPGSTWDACTYCGVFYFWLGYVTGLNNNHTCVHAPLNLPHGVTVDSLVLTAVDDYSGTLDLYLRRKSAFSTTEAIMAHIATDLDSPGLGAWFDFTVYNAVINNSLYQYYLEACLNQHMQLHSVFVYYN